MKQPEAPSLLNSKDERLAERIMNSSAEKPVTTSLTTDDRVLARITDGIYRQPGSALRELISNAYDADATRVVIQTDRPRFDRIIVEDDGRGMTEYAIAHLLRHIGGSAKRSHGGSELGITSSDDPDLSPGGRRLIGKIGIGLFSVAQLGQRFQIITKTEGADHRTIATVVMRQFSDDAVHDVPAAGEKYEAGKVKIWREPATDHGAHGTTVILTDMRPRTKETLQSLDIWAAIDDQLSSPDRSRQIPAPQFHIGRVDRDNPDLLRGDPPNYDNVPWDPGDPPEDAFRSLVEAVAGRARRVSAPNPKLDTVLDYYLRMLWQLALAIPAPYIDGHPFEIPLRGKAFTYEMPISRREAPSRITLGPDGTIADALGLEPRGGVGADFQVFVDDVKLVRPLRFRGLPKTSHKVTRPIIFAASCREEFDGVPPELSGGPLEFQAYLMWAPKVIPVEHQGILIRIHGASGTLFDPGFLRYQVSEPTRLRQMTGEIFVSMGMEAALNIDRESFNYAHPHVVYLTKWLHSALRRSATVQKRIAQQAREKQRDKEAALAEDRLAAIVADTWREESGDEGSAPPEVGFIGPGTQPDGDGYYFDRLTVFPELGGRRGRPPLAAQALERRLRAVVQILAAYELLDDLTPTDQEALVARLRQVLDESD